MARQEPIRLSYLKSLPRMEVVFAGATFLGNANVPAFVETRYGSLYMPAPVAPVGRNWKYSNHCFRCQRSVLIRNFVCLSTRLPAGCDNNHTRHFEKLLAATFSELGLLKCPAWVGLRFGSLEECKKANNSEYDSTTTYTIPMFSRPYDVLLVHRLREDGKTWAWYQRAKVMGSDNLYIETCY